MMCAFVSRLPQHIRQLLRALSQMDTINVEQLLTQVRVIMADVGECELLLGLTIWQETVRPEGSDGAWLQTMVFSM